jgi:hypothetical protein
MLLPPTPAGHGADLAGSTAPFRTSGVAIAAFDGSAFRLSISAPPPRQGSEENAAHEAYMLLIYGSERVWEHEQGRNGSDLRRPSRLR